MDDFTKIPPGCWESTRAASGIRARQRRAPGGREAGGGGVRGARADLRPLPEEGRCGA
jgi:hypothetical protein